MSERAPRVQTVHVHVHARATRGCLFTRPRPVPRPCTVTLVATDGPVRARTHAGGGYFDPDMVHTRCTSPNAANVYTQVLDACEAAGYVINQTLAVVIMENWGAVGQDQIKNVLHVAFNRHTITGVSRSEDHERHMGEDETVADAQVFGKHVFSHSGGCRGQAHIPRTRCAVTRACWARGATPPCAHTDAHAHAHAHTHTHTRCVPWPTPEHCTGHRCMHVSRRTLAVVMIKLPTERLVVVVRRCSCAHNLKVAPNPAPRAAAGANLTTHQLRVLSRAGARGHTRVPLSAQHELARRAAASVRHPGSQRYVRKAAAAAPAVHTLARLPRQPW